jgi:hypothetical protein
MAEIFQKKKDLLGFVEYMGAMDKESKLLSTV